MEIYFSGTWGTITDSEWSSDDAQVACRKLGYFKPGIIIFSHCFICHVALLFSCTNINARGESLGDGASYVFGVAQFVLS